MNSPLRTVNSIQQRRELGLDFVYTTAVGIAVPRGLPEPTVNRLHEAFSKAFEDPETLRILDSLKKDPWPMTPAAYSAWAQEAVRQERTMVERAGLLMK